MRVGGTRSIAIDVRVIASTNQNLTRQIAEGKFREDLYYRLNVVPIHLPPLRDRLEDLPMLAHVLLEKYNKKYEKSKRLDLGAQMAMEQYHWPGNIRELGNILERLVVSDDEPLIGYDSVMLVLERHKDHAHNNRCHDQLEAITLAQAVERLEKQWIENALNTHGSTYKAAKALGTSQPTLFRKAKQLGVLLEKQKELREF
jgi:transcriptional regulator with PAS, ATPase and Fis domain